GFKVDNIPKLSFFFAAQFRQLFEDFFDAHSSCLKVTDFSHFGHSALSGGDASCLQNILGRCDLLCFLGVRLGSDLCGATARAGSRNRSREIGADGRSSRLLIGSKKEGHGTVQSTDPDFVCASVEVEGAFFADFGFGIGRRNNLDADVWSALEESELWNVLFA